MRAVRLRRPRYRMQYLHAVPSFALCFRSVPVSRAADEVGRFSLDGTKHGGRITLALSYAVLPSMDCKTDLGLAAGQFPITIWLKKAVILDYLKLMIVCYGLQLWGR